MIIFLLEVEKLTENYHSGGGLVVIAESIEAAKELISKDKYIKPTQEEWDTAETYYLKGQPKPKYIIYPDAGCC